MMSNSENEIVDETCDFGKKLSEARKAQSFTISEINEHIKIPEHVLTAIETCDITALPAPAFTQGYIRAYAKFLEISEDDILDSYNRMLPGKSASELKPRSNLPRDTGKQSPLIKMVTVILIVAGVAALFYGSFQYYQKKADVMETELESKERSFTGNSLDSPGSQQLEVQQNARLNEEGELVLQQTDTVDLITEEGEVDTEPSDAPTQDIVESVQENEVVSSRMEQAATEPGEDVIKFFAERGSWMEVRDANNARLFYNTLPEGASSTFKGLAPFRVFMGNAETTTVEINNLEVDLTGRIRSNNTAKFKVSSEDKKVIFH